MTTTYDFWLAYCRASGDADFEVHNSWDGRLVGKVSVPTEAQVEEALEAAVAALPVFAATPAHVRSAALDHVARRLAERTEEIARLITAENGKPIKWARGEVGRAVSVFRWAAEEARRTNGETMRLDTDPGGVGRFALVRRFPRGVVLGIAPFNFPLNLVAHKVAPAIAVGAPIILKPAPATPLSAMVLGEILAETDLPTGSWSVLPVPNDRICGPGAGPAAAGDLLHRFGQGRLPDHGLGAAQAHHPGAGRQRRGRGARRLVLRGGPGLGGHPDRDVRQLPGRPVLHLGAARDRRRLGLRRAGGEGRRQGGRAGHR